MKCVKCGFDIGDFPFCPKCGTKALQETQEAPPMEIVLNEQTLSEEVENNTAEQKGNTPTVEKKKKPALWIIAGSCVLLILLVTLIINGISGSKKTTSNSTTYSSSNSSSNSSSSSSSNSSSYSKVGYTDSELEILACSALYDELMTAKSKQGVPLSNWYNIDATTYSIGSIKGNSSDGWTVKGTFNLYNDYGVYRKSGTFTARISGYGFATCTISLD